MEGVQLSLAAVVVHAVELDAVAGEPVHVAGRCLYEVFPRQGVDKVVEEVELGADDVLEGEVDAELLLQGGSAGEDALGAVAVAAGVGIRLDNNDALSRFGSRNGGGEPGHAGAYDNDIAVFRLGDVVGFLLGGFPVARCGQIAFRVAAFGRAAHETSRDGGAAQHSGGFEERST